MLATEARNETHNHQDDALKYALVGVLFKAQRGELHVSALVGPVGRG